MSKKTVLLIEDDEWLLEQYTRLLNDDYKILTTNSAKEAIDIIDDKMPDVIVLDVLLSGSTAFALIHELQSYEDTCSIPVILCTSLASEISEKDITPYGVVKILDKTTMLPSDLKFAINSVIL